MNHKIERHDQYALIRLQEESFSEAVPAALEAVARGLLREGQSNLIVEMNAMRHIDAVGVGMIRKLNRLCTAELGLLVIATENDEFADTLENANIADLTLLPTVEESIDAVFMNELENDFGMEEDDDDEFDTSEFGEDSGEKGEEV